MLPSSNHQHIDNDGLLVDNYGHPPAQKNNEQESAIIIIIPWTGLKFYFTGHTATIKVSFVACRWPSVSMINN